MAAPTFVQEVESANWLAQTTSVTPTFDVLAGDLLVAFGIGSDNSLNLAISNNGTALTWTQRQVTNTASTCKVYCWTAPVPADRTGLTVTATGSGDTSNRQGITVQTWRNSDGIGNSSQSVDQATNDAPDTDVTTTQANSAIALAIGDWNAIDGTTRTPVTATAGAFTERTYFRDASWYTVYSGYHADAGAIGTKTVGYSAPVNQESQIVAVEILGSAGGGTDGTVTVPAPGDALGDAPIPTVTVGPIESGILDDFNRADGNVEAGAGAAKWLSTSHDGNDAVNQIESNTVGSNGGRGNLSAFTLPADFDIEFEFTAGPASGANLYVAVDSPGASFDAFLFNFGFTGPTNYGITRYTAGSAVGGGLDSTISGPTKSVGARCRAVRDGSTLELYVDPDGSSGWTLVCSATDSSFYAAAPIELQCGSGANLDNLKWSGTDATVTLPAPGDAIGDAPVPSLSAGAAVTTPAGDATGDAPVAANAISVQVEPPAAAATGDAPVPSVSASADASTTTPAGDATGDAPVPGVSADAAVTAPAGDGLGDAPVPGVSADSPGSVTAPAGTAAGDAPVPGVSAGAAVTTPAGDATGAAPPPTASAGTGGTVTAPAGAATGDAPVPGVSATSNPTVTAPAASASGDAPPPAPTSSTSAPPPIDGDVQVLIRNPAGPLHVTARGVTLTSVEGPGNPVLAVLGRNGGSLGVTCRNTAASVQGRNSDVPGVTCRNSAVAVAAG